MLAYCVICRHQPCLSLCPLHLRHRDENDYPMRIVILSERSESKDLSQSHNSFCHRDENRVPATPLESALTNRDACNSFRFCSYTNCRVSLPLACSFLKYYLNSPRLFFLFSANTSKFSLCVFSGLRTLLFYVGLNSFVCHSYENCRGVPSSSHFGTSRPTNTSRQGLLFASSLFRSVFTSFTSLLHYLLFARPSRLCHNSGNHFHRRIPRFA